jgi:glycine/D-amino acid oxidase-like deaminating enzyme
MDLKAGYPFSLVRYGIPYDYPKLEKNSRCEVLVIGAGISGALAAHYLQDAGFECMIIDGRTVGLGSTCASTSLLQYEIDVPLYQLAVKISEHRASRAYQLCADAIGGIGELSQEVGSNSFQFKQSLQLAQYKKDINALHTEAEMRRHYGFNVELISSSALKREYGIIAPGALLTRLAAETDAYLLTHQVIQFNLKRGLKIFDRSRAIKFTRNKQLHRVVLENGCEVDCKFIVYANGYEASHLLAPGKVHLQSTYVTISESISLPFPFWKDDTLVWTTGNPYLYMRTTPDSRILVGGRDENLVSPPIRDKLIASKARQLARDFCKRVPAVPFKSEFSWTGIFASTPDGLPYIGELPGKPNAYIALGYGGNGITFGWVAAQMICDLISGKPNADLDIFSPTR